MNTYQTHHRLREAQSRKRAEDLNRRVMYWSIGETLLIIVIGLGEVVILRSFFSEKKGRESVSKKLLWGALVEQICWLNQF